MTIRFESDEVVLHHGDCLDVLASLPDASVDSVVTDPPYGLANTDPAHVAETITRWVNGERDYLPGGTGFMGKAWDAFVPPVAVWDECLRVLKPGGHVLAFAGSRTMDLMTLGLRLAGFDIRDSIAWLYGSGFPKSMDVSKAIDKARSDDNEWREVGQWLKARREAAGYASRNQFAPLILDGHKNLESAAANLSNWENGLSFPTWERWLSLKALLNLPDDMDADVWRLNGRKGAPGDAWQSAEVVGTQAGAMAGWDMSGGTKFVDREIKAANSDAAREWQGWGTALKPAFEPIVVARKPLQGTVASNVLAHGTGALNIDASRIGTTDRLSGSGTPPLQYGGANARPFHAEHEATPTVQHAAGRFPANVILDEPQAAELDRQSGLASRFFYTVREDNETCPSPDPASTAAPSTYPRSASVASAHGHAATSASHATSKPTRSPSTPAMPSASKPNGAPSTPAMTPTASVSSPESPPARRTPTLSPASSAETRRPTGTTTTTTSPSTSVGSAAPATSSTTPASAPGVPLDELGSRFIYTAKADSAERPVVDGIAHPTVKPIDLMRYLVRLVTPKGGTVLEPFAGSGTTLEAAVLEGFRCIGIEREADYLPLIIKRLDKPHTVGLDLFGDVA